MRGNLSRRDWMPAIRGHGIRAPANELKIIASPEPHTLMPLEGVSHA